MFSYLLLFVQKHAKLMAHGTHAKFFATNLFLFRFLGLFLDS